MENVYKVKIRTNPDPMSLYPSERRYSASTVLGLGVIHLCFAVLALIFASLSLLSRPYAAEDVAKLLEDNTFVAANEEDTLNYVGDQAVLSLKGEAATDDGMDFFSPNATNERRERDIINSLRSIPCVYLTIASCVMCSGAFLAGLAALLAWKRWYVDNNIKWFCLASFVSTVTSCSSLSFAVTTVVITFEKVHELSGFTTATPHFKLGLSVHVLLASLLELMWSLLSTRTAFQGMKNVYPDDVMAGKRRGKVEVTTVQKGSKKIKIVRPDILNHFHLTEKFAKYFPRKESTYLPKAESNSEYQDRVRKFLSSNTDASSVK